ncbi:MAG: sel1 repeat family protein [Candidatus Cloacimonetes bacterium]|nr:sel1 repeat family protein [Candidatus Cloacimonadota bacterium]
MRNSYFILLIILILCSTLMAQSAQELEKEALAGSAEAQFKLGEIYFNGESSIPRSHKDAAYWYELSASQEEPAAQNNLGFMYEHGVYYKQNHRRAFDYYKKAAEQDYPEALFNTARCYYNGIGVTIDMKKSAKYYKKAAGADVPEAQFNLGTMFYTGTGVIESKEKAEFWIRKAAGNGHVQAQKAIEKIFNKQQEQSNE